MNKQITSHQRISLRLTTWQAGKDLEACLYEIVLIFQSNRLSYARKKQVTNEAHIAIPLFIHL